MLVGNLVEALTPVPFITYITGIKAAKNRKMTVPPLSSPANLKHRRGKLQKAHLCELLQQ